MIGKYEFDPSDIGAQVWNRLSLIPPVESCSSFECLFFCKNTHFPAVQNSRMRKNANI